MQLQQINSLSPQAAQKEFLSCCGSRRWAALLSTRLPFKDKAALYRSAQEIWNSLSPDDWKEAFSHHPKIGDLKSLREKFPQAGPQRRTAAAQQRPEAALPRGEPRSEPALPDHSRVPQTQQWAAGEQSGASNAAGETLKALAEGNSAYQEKFGYIFIVCASGKSAEEMLKILNHRLNNEPSDEVRAAALEQSKITQIRLEKLIQ